MSGVWPRRPLAPRPEGTLALQQRLSVSGEHGRDALRSGRRRAIQPLRDHRDLHFGNDPANETRACPTRHAPESSRPREPASDGLGEDPDPECADGRFEEHAVQTVQRPKVLQQRHLLSGPGVTGYVGGEIVPRVFQPVGEQRLLAGVMQVERGAADPGPADEIRDRKPRDTPNR